MKKIMTIVVLVSLLSACGGLSFLKNRKARASSAKPVALNAIEAAVSVKRIWERDTGSGSAKVFLRLVPAILNDTVYVADSRGQVSAFNAQTGKTVWSTHTKLPVTGATGVGEGLVLVGTRDGEVIALDAANGKISWRSQLSSEILSPPAASQGIVVARTVDGKVFGLAVEDGHSIWIYERGVPSLSLRGTAAPYIHGSKVINGFASGKLAANDLQSGVVLWESSVGFSHGRNELERLIDVDAQPVAFGDVLYTAAYQGKVVAMELKTGRILWEQKASTFNDIAVDDSRVFVSDEKTGVIALDRAKGNPIWVQKSLKGRGLTAPTRVGEYLVVLDELGQLHVMAVSDGRLVGRLKVGNTLTATRPIASGSRMFLLTPKGDLTVFQIGT
ncbi:MAG TPA: outer membrane protein assembly factor BamB [Acidiferrobacteraceae bacterium]|nr:outer membrane protein assembly factor BamB [Acidiferrobacteraceae bacterium]